MKGLLKMEAKKNTNLILSSQKPSHFIQRLSLVTKPLGYTVSSVDTTEDGVALTLESEQIIVILKSVPRGGSSEASAFRLAAPILETKKTKPTFTVHFSLDSIELDNHHEYALENHESIGLLLAPQNQVGMKVFRSLLLFLSDQSLELSPKFLMDSQVISGQSVVTTYEQKNNVLAEIMESIQAAARPTAPQWLRKLMARVSLVTDELILNTGVKGKLDDDQIPTAQSYDASVHWALDGEFLVVAITDFCGTLSRENITETLFRKGMRKENGMVAGGLGFKTVWNATQDLVILVRPQELTRVLCRFPLSAEATAYQSSSLWLLCP